MESAQPDKFQITLDNGGEVQNVNVDNAPDGWLGTKITYSRSLVYMGLVRSLTLPYKFTRTAASILRFLFYKYGIIARCSLIINKLIYSTWTYALLYKGTLDFSQWVDELTGVTLNAIEQNINVQVDAYADTQYAIPLDVDEAVPVLLTPIKLNETAQMIVNATPDFRSDAFFQVSIAGNTQLATLASVQNTGFLAQNPPVLDKTQNNYFEIARTKTTVRITSGFNLDGTVNMAGFQTSVNTGTFQFNIYKSDGTLVKTLATCVNPGTTTQFTFGFDFSVSLEFDDRLFFYIKRTAGAVDSFQGVNIQVGTMSLSYYTASPATMCKGLRLQYVFDYLINQMAGNLAPIQTQSFLFRDVLSNLVITCSNSILTTQLEAIYQAGDNLQIGARYVVIGGSIVYVTQSGISHTYAVGETFTALVNHPTFTTDPDQDGFVRQISNAPELILSWHDFFQSIYAIMGGQCGFGLDNGIACIEDLSYFFRPGVTVMDLGDINNFQLSPNTDVAFNTIRVGYNDQQYDAVNGYQEFNSTQEYAVQGLVTVNKELNLLSVIRGDSLGIESLRLIQANTLQNSAASKSDNDCFFIGLRSTVETSGYFQPKTIADGCPTYSGVQCDLYNYEYSPKQNLLRGGRYIASVLDGLSGYNLQETSALKNSAMVTIDATGRRVAEGENVQVSSLGKQIFKPYYCSMTAGLEYNTQSIIDNTPYGPLSFNWNNKTQRGFIWELPVDAGTDTPNTLKLLLTADTVMGDFVF